MTDPLDPKLDRRSLLQKGAIAGASVTLLSKAGSADAATPAAATSALNCNDVVSDKLDPVDEDCELALGYMWCHFARQAKTQKATDIEWQAVRYARAGKRLQVHDQVDEHGLDDFIATIFPTEHRADWTRLATEAAKTGGVITESRMKAAWKTVYGTSHDPDKIADLRPIVERAVEVIGSQMWFQFTLGVVAQGVKVFDVDVLKAGRSHSRHYVRKNANKACIVPVGSTSGCVDSDGRDCIDYAGWKWAEVTPCCLKAGKDSHVYADQTGKPDIEPNHFHDAWCDGNTFMVRLNERLRKQGKQEIFTSGCG